MFVRKNQYVDVGSTNQVQATRRLQTRFFAWSVLYLFSVGLPAIAQNATLNGTVLDPAGAAVGGARVSALQVSTGFHREARTSSTGNYSIPSLPPGSYVVSVAQPGFTTVEQRGVELFVGTPKQIDLQLRLGSATESVVVTTGDQNLQPDTPEAATEITREKFNDLPLVQQGRIRSPAAFIFLAPGVQGNISVSGLENTSATNQFVINGSQMQVSEFYLDGVEFGQMRTVGSLNESAPPVDAVREFKVTTTLLPADYGHSGPAAGFFSIRAGANTLHGSLYEYFRNDYLDARPWGAVNLVYTRQNEFGATLGGAIRVPHLFDGHNRSFFFFSYGGSRKRGADSIQNLRLPSLAQQHGDFSSSSLFKVYDPLTTALNTAGTAYVRKQFANNIIPADRIDPVAAKIVALLPAPNLPVSAGTNDYQAFKGERLLDPDAFTFRLDHQLTQAHHLTGTYVHTYIPRDKIGTGLPGILSSDSHQLTAGTTIRASEDWVLSASQLNSFTFGFNRFANTQTPPNGDFGLSGLPSAALPYFAFTQSYPDIANNGHYRNFENNYQFRDVLNWAFGAHLLRVGGELRAIQLNDTNPSPAFTTINISDLETQNPANPSKTGDAFASFLLGQVDRATTGVPYEIGTRYKYAGFFVQDDWKATKQLTLNLGLRWEFQTIPTEVNNHQSIISLSTPNPGAGNLPGALIFAGYGAGLAGTSQFAPTHYGAVGPRFGISYAASPRTVLRGGYGVYYSDTGVGTAVSLNSTGFSAQANILSPDNGIHPAFTLASGFPSVPSLRPVLSPTLLNPNGSTVQNGFYIERGAGRMPSIQEWDGGIQRELGKRWVLELDYVGNHGTHLFDPNAENVNQLDPAYLRLGSLLTVPVASSQAVAAGIKAPYAGFTGTVAQALRPFPQYGTLTSLAGKNAYNSYNALQVVAVLLPSHYL